jgi:hypothetical protein
MTDAEDNTRIALWDYATLPRVRMAIAALQRAGKVTPEQVLDLAVAGVCSADSGESGGYQCNAFDLWAMCDMIAPMVDAELRKMMEDDDA